MKKVLITLVVMISIASSLRAQVFPAQVFTGKVSPQELANNNYLVMYYNNLPMNTAISSLPEEEMIRIMQAIDKQCESNYLLNLVYAKQPNNNILKKAIKENVIIVQGISLIDWNRALRGIKN